jgi:indole-3-glycerol phosphate synthase
VTAAEPTARSLAASIRRRQAEGVMPVLSEIKVRSPREGDLLRGRTPEDLAAVMATLPIAGVSVVTDLIHFGGDTDIIRTIRPLVPAPILRKDFTHSERDLDDTVACGADAILLTVCLLDDEPLTRLHDDAHDRGLQGSVLLSESAISGPDDARRARAAGADAVLVGTSILQAPDPAEAIRALTGIGWPQPPAVA